MNVYRTNPLVVEIISSTPHPVEMLILSKRTRLNMVPGLFEEVKAMSQSEKDKELGYIFSTISSSLEFVDYTMLICGVTRAFTHQLVRHRAGTSFAQQSMRTVDLSSGFDWLATGSCLNSLDEYSEGMNQSAALYAKLVDKGVLPQDARGVVPTNATTNILMKINLRALAELMSTRLCHKAQGEFQLVAREIRSKVLMLHPWTEPVMRVYCARHGVCCFPRVKECPVKMKFPSLSVGEQFLKDVQSYRDNTQSEAKPVGSSK